MVFLLRNTHKIYLILQKRSSRHRCVSKIASPEARKSESTTALYKSIVVYLKSPRRRREKAKVLQRYAEPRESTNALYKASSTYRCVPKIASPEAQNPKMQISRLQNAKCSQRENHFKKRSSSLKFLKFLKMPAKGNIIFKKCYRA